MKCPRLSNNRGLTLVELIVALGLTSIVMVAMVAGVLFLQRQLRDWSEDTQWQEEVAFVRGRLAEIVAQSTATSVFRDRIVCHDPDGRGRVINWSDSVLTVDSKPLLRGDFSVGPVSVNEIHPQLIGDNNLRTREPLSQRSLQISFVVSAAGHPSTEITFVVREIYVYSTFESVGKIQ